MDVRVLVVDDEKEIVDLIEVYLLNENYTVVKYYNVTDALAYLKDNAVDIAILDVMLPDGDGFDLCRRIRGIYTFPIIMLTARDAEGDKINGLYLGADDYITKPFKPLELVARVKAQLRRYTRYNSSDAKRAEENARFIVHRGLVIDVPNHECTLDGGSLCLTPTEFEILRILCERKGAVVSSEELFHSIWKDEYYVKNNNTITTHVRHLREKLKDSVENPKYIKTVWGVGYKIEG